MEAKPFDPDTGEILQPPREHAADGRELTTAAFTGGAMLDLLEEGQFGVDLHTALAEVAKATTDQANRTGNKSKGSVSIKLEIERDGDSFRIRPELKVVTPKDPRPRSTMWVDQHMNFTRFPPQQTQLFGNLKRV